MARFIDELKRTHHCAELRAAHEGNTVVLFGWVASYRDHGGCVFVDLRDREGITQLVFDPDTKGHGDLPKRSYELAQSLRSEWVIGIRGTVISRGTNKNPRLPTGEIEVHVIELGVFNRSDTPPFEIADKIDTGEEKRLQHRYLDLRRQPLQQSLRVRHRIHQVTRRYFDETGFLELETPFMVKYTPGGARNFLVPSRMNAGEVLRPRREPAALQAALHGGGLRQLLPDREVLPRRGPPRSTASRSSPRSTWRCPSSTRTTSSRRHRGAGLPRVARGPRGRPSRSLSRRGASRRCPSRSRWRTYGNDKPDLRFGLAHTDADRPGHRAPGRRRGLLEAHRRQVRQRRVPEGSPRGDREGAAHPGRPGANSRARSSTSSRTT